MKILVCNDDGIGSEGIFQLADALGEIGDVTVIAPQTEQSAVGHSITMKVPLRYTKYNLRNKYTKVWILNYYLNVTSHIMNSSNNYTR